MCQIHSQHFQIYGIYEYWWEYWRIPSMKVSYLDYLSIYVRTPENVDKYSVSPILAFFPRIGVCAVPPLCFVSNQNKFISYPYCHQNFWMPSSLGLVTNTIDYSWYYSSIMMNPIILYFPRFLINSWFSCMQPNYTDVTFLMIGWSFLDFYIEWHMMPISISLSGRNVGISSNFRGDPKLSNINRIWFFLVSIN